MQHAATFATAPNFTTRQVTNVLNKYALSGHCPEFTTDYFSTLRGTGEYNAKWAKHIELVLAVAGMFKSGTEFARIVVEKPQLPKSPKPQDPEIVKKPVEQSRIDRWGINTEFWFLVKCITPDLLKDTLPEAFENLNIDALCNMLGFSTLDELANAVKHYILECKEKRLPCQFSYDHLEEIDQWPWDDQYIDFIGWMLGFNPDYSTRFRRSVLEKLEGCRRRAPRKSARSVYVVSEEETVSEPEFSLTDVEQDASDSCESEEPEIEVREESEEREFSEDYEDEDELEDF